MRRAADRSRRLVNELLTRGQRGVEKPPSWRRTMRKTLRRMAMLVGATLFLAVIFRALWVTVTGDPLEFPFGFNPDGGCRDTGYSCGVVSGIAMTLLSLAFATAVFFVNRLRKARKSFLQRARYNTRELVETAGTIIGSVVGRDELCNVIMDDLRDRHHRRPHVVLGGVGVGKTAVLVELTRRLAEHGALPVPVRLRDAQKELDFTALARRRFTAVVGRTARSDAEADRAWRELRKDDQIVVVADGLEEALVESDGLTRGGDGENGTASSERDNLIRLAMRVASRDRLPLVVASRPHDALAGLDAAIVELEPLGEEHALEYIQEGASTHNEQRLDWVIETADVTETPLYLQLAHELHRIGLLEHASPGQDFDQLDTRGNDRVGLRLRLLETWTRALTRGYFHPEVPMSNELREATVQQLGVLACVGLMKDRLEVQFTDVPDGGGLHQALWDVIKTLYQTLGFRGRDVEKMESQSDDGKEAVKLAIRRELQLAVTRGVRLDLVEARGGGVRFPHSIMQAYLASRVIGSVVDKADGYDYKNGADYLKVALEHASRELLAALVMHSRASREDAGGEPLPRDQAPDHYPDPKSVRERLLSAARAPAQPIGKAIDLVVAALEIDSVAVAPEHERWAGELESIWPQESEDRTVEEAKLKAVMRFGEVARKVQDRVGERGRKPEPPADQADQSSAPANQPAQQPAEEPVRLRPAYHHLYRIACKDVWYPVRLAAAQEIGRGGDEALARLGDGTWDPDAKKYTFGERNQTLKQKLGPCPQSHDCWKDEDVHRELVLKAWLAPLLVSSATTHLPEAQVNLEDWLDYAGVGDGRSETRAPLSLEIALAQGFKHAANRRPGRSRGAEAAHHSLADKAAEMLKSARFWFSRLTLVQALCLWALPDPDMARERPKNDQEPRERRRKEPQRRESDPAALIKHWLSSAPDRQEHPFVEEACKLAVLALERRQPERYIWIDESGVVTKIGSRAPRSDARRKHNLWIPPSTGWSALDRRAQRLVADVLILLNLAERGGDPPVEREKRLRRAMRDDLPACLAGERSYLEVDRTVGMVHVPTAGAKCKDGCAFDLCPYPPKGTSQTYRVELSEAFCRRQQVLLGRWWNLIQHRTAPWQGAVPGELKEFWMRMEERARR